MGKRKISLAWEEELKKIIKDYKEGSGTGKLTKPEIDDLIGHLKHKMWLLEGHVNEDQYLYLEG